MITASNKQLASLKEVPPGEEWSGEYSVIIRHPKADFIATRQISENHKNWLEEEFKIDKDKHPNEGYFIKLCHFAYFGKFSEDLLLKIRERDDVECVEKEVSKKLSWD